MLVYTHALDAVRDWQTATAGTFAARLFKSGSFNRDHDFVNDLVPGTNEVTVAGYGPIDLTGLTRTVNLTDNQIEYGGDRPDFGTLASGEDAVAMLVYRRAVATVDTDATSIPMGWLEFDPARDTGAVDPFKVVLTADLFFIDRAGAGS